MPTDPHRSPPNAPAPAAGIQRVPPAQGAPAPAGRGGASGQPPRGYHPQHPISAYPQQPQPPAQYGAHGMGRGGPPAPRGYYQPAAAGYQTYPAAGMSYPQQGYGMPPGGFRPPYGAYQGYPPQAGAPPPPPPGQTAGGQATAQPPQTMGARDYSQQPRRPIAAPKPRASKALKIIDPSTNAEVTIAKSAETKTDDAVAKRMEAAKKSSKLEVKAPDDPAPGTTSAKTGDQVVPDMTKAAGKVAAKEPIQTPAKAAVATPVKTAEPAAAATQGGEKSGTATKAEARSKSTPVPVAVVREVANTTSPVTPMPAAPVVSATNKPEEERKDAAPDAASNGAVKPAADGDKPKPVAPVPEKPSSNEGATKDTNATTTTDEKPKAEASSPDKGPEEAASGPAKRVRPTSPNHGPGDRKVYSIEFIMGIRAFIDTTNSAYEPMLLKANISKKSAGTPMRQGGRGRSGGGGGVLSDDPRRRVAPPTTGNFNMSQGGRSSSLYATGGGGGNMDTFDIAHARLQAPPQVPGGGGGGRVGRDDPRGKRTQGPDRFSGPNRFGVGPLDPMTPNYPVEKLKKGENGWKRNKEADDEVTAKVKSVRSLLNKLTLEKFDKILGQIVAIDISSVEILKGVVGEVFEKTLFEPKFSSMYASLCKRLDELTKEMLQKAELTDAQGKPLNFRRILLKSCQDEFTRFQNSGAKGLTAETPVEGGDAEAKKADAKTAEAKKDEAKKDDKEAGEKDGEKKEDGESKEEEDKEKAAKVAKEAKEAALAKKRMLANIRFIGSLYMEDLISDNIIHKSCVVPLLRSGISLKEEETLEALCKLLANTGFKLSGNPQGKKLVDQYFQPLVQLSRDHSLPARIRFMIQDLLEQRNNNWKARREEAKAKKISEIHKDIEKEERAKAEAQAQARDRRGRGGGGHDRHRRNYSTPVTMTMAPRQSGGGQGQSRASAQLEKFANRSNNFGGRNAQNSNVRLGPGGANRNAGGANGWKSMSGGASIPSRSTTAPGAMPLRPRSRNPFAALDTDAGDTAAPAGGSGDVRRGSRFNTGGLSGASAASAKTAAPKPAVAKMDIETVKRKAKSIVSEFWSIKDMKEATECLVQEVKAPNYSKWLEMAIRVSVDGKIGDRPMSAPLFTGLLQRDVLKGSHVTEAVGNVLGDLDNIETDNPLASNSISLYTAAMVKSGKIGGLGSVLKGVIGKIENPKRFVKFVVLTLKHYGDGLKEAGEEEAAVQSKVVSEFQGLNVDIAGKMLEFNPMRGLDSLEDMLKDNKMVWLMPLLPAQKKVTEMMAGGKSAKEIFEAVKALGVGEETLKGAGFTTMVVRAGLSSVFSEPTAEMGKTFKESAGALVALANGGKAPTADTQMKVILGVQTMLVGKNEFGELVGEWKGKKYGEVAFDLLYDADVVVEESFDAWKVDDGVSLEVDGKGELMLESVGFFKWLAVAEPEGE